MLFLSNLPLLLALTVYLLQLFFDVLQLHRRVLARPIYECLRLRHRGVRILFFNLQFFFQMVNRLCLLRLLVHCVIIGKFVNWIDCFGASHAATIRESLV